MFMNYIICYVNSFSINQKLNLILTLFLFLLFKTSNPAFHHNVRYMCLCVLKPNIALMDIFLLLYIESTLDEGNEMTQYLSYTVHNES